VRDVIIVGARVAGSATAMLLARKGLDVLVVDRATFPSDTLSTHVVQLPGVARLHRWGLLDQVIASGAPPARRLRFDVGTVLEGPLPELDGADGVYSPRRIVLDQTLVEAAREAGAEVREDFVVDELTTERGTVTGIRGARKGGAQVTESARLVIGADGKHSLVALAVEAESYRERPALTLASYAYWEGVTLEGGEIYQRDRRAMGAWPTNDGLTMTFVAWPVNEFETYRADPVGNLLATLDRAGDLGERVRAGRLVEHVRTSPDLPNRFHRAHGPGWALVGDAGLVMDPITAQGISDALRDAELLAEAAAAGLDGTPMGRALEGYQKARDAEVGPMYDFTTDLASFHPPRPEEELLFQRLAEDPAEANRFLGVITGAIPMAEYFSPKNLVKLLGFRGMLRAMVSRVRSGRRPGAEPHPDDSKAKVA
jgi:2-polyprenyl-6-methoxyphenol hydroxylase-like FAD-dependent oxidoreductase